MALPAVTQLCQAGWSLLLGAGLGVLYDLLGGARDRAHLPAWAGDTLFALAAVGALFVGGAASLEGRPRLYMALAALAGGALWEAGAAPVARLLFAAAWGQAARAAAFLARPVRKAADFLKKFGKKLFSNGRKWFTIIVTHWKQTVRDRKGGARHEAAPDQLDDGAGDRGPDRLRLYRPDEYADKSGLRQ